MPIPRTRSELIRLVTTSYAKLRDELQRVTPEQAELPCVDDWSVRDLLAVRAWWTERVVEWIEVGRRGESPVTPSPGYSWRETPRLNADVVHEARDEVYTSIRDRLERGFRRVIATIESLNDEELLGVGVFGWAGKWPVSRWISLNTARQYTTARKHIRRALRQHESSHH